MVDGDRVGVMGVGGRTTLVNMINVNVCEGVDRIYYCRKTTIRQGRRYYLTTQIKTSTEYIKYYDILDSLFMIFTWHELNSIA